MTINLPGVTALDFNPTDSVTNKYYEDEATKAGETLTGALVSMYQPDYTKRDSRVFRASQVGHPALEVAYNYFYGLPSGHDETTKLIFWFGHAFEQWARHAFVRSDAELVDEQRFHDYQGITGYSDFIVKGHDGKQFIVDAKAINNRAFVNYQKNGLTDDRGYATQLSIYASHVKLPACVLMMNKETGEVDHVWLEEQTKERCLDRAVKVKQVIESVQSFEECFKYFRPPVPKAEVHRKEYTGRFLPPVTMKFHCLRDVLYETYTDKNERGEEKVYVSDYRYPESQQQHKPDINAH